MLFPHDTGVIADIGNGGDHLCQPEQIRFPLLSREKALGFERLQHRDKIDGLGRHELFAHHPVHGLMLGKVKILRAQNVRHLVKAGGVHEHGPQHRLLRLQTVGQVQSVAADAVQCRHSSTSFLKIPPKAQGNYSVTITLTLAVKP